MITGFQSIQGMWGMGVGDRGGQRFTYPVRGYIDPNDTSSSSDSSSDESDTSEIKADGDDDKLYCSIALTQPAFNAQRLLSSTQNAERIPQKTGGSFSLLPTPEGLAAFNTARYLLLPHEIEAMNTEDKREEDMRAADIKHWEKFSNKLERESFISTGADDLRCVDTYSARELHDKPGEKMSKEVQAILKPLLVKKSRAQQSSTRQLVSNSSNRRFSHTRANKFKH
jgi:hypothetical protein